MGNSPRTSKKVIKLSHKIVAEIIRRSLCDTSYGFRDPSLTDEENRQLLKALNKIADCHDIIGKP
jgi:hypothetical protein